MHPFERGRSTLPPGVRPSLQLLLKEGWRLAPRKRSFVSPGGEEHRLKGILPSGARIVPTAPALARAAPDKLSDDERYLARHVQVILPQGADMDEFVAPLRRLDPVEEVRVPPQIGLA